MQGEQQRDVRERAVGTGSGGRRARGSRGPGSRPRARAVQCPSAAGRSGPSRPLSPCTCAATERSRTRGPSAPRCTGTSPCPANSSTRRRSPWSSRSSGCRRRCDADELELGRGECEQQGDRVSWPGSQSRMIGVGFMPPVSRPARPRSAGKVARRASSRRAPRRRRPGGAPRHAAAARGSRARVRREGVARGRAVDDVDPRRRRSRDLSPVLVEHGTLGAQRDRDEPARRHDLVLEAVDDQQVGLDRDRACGRGVQGEERGLVGRLEDDVVRNLELAEHGAFDLARRQELVRAGHDDDLVLAVCRDEDQREPGAAGTLQVELDAGRVEVREGLVGLGVVADRADEPNRRAEPGCGDGLVRALAARKPVEGGRGERLAGPRQPVDLRDEVEVDRADDGELGAELRRRWRGARRELDRAGSRGDRTARPKASRRRSSTASGRWTRGLPARGRRRRARGRPRRPGAPRRARRRGRAQAPSRRARRRSARRTTSGSRPSRPRARAGSGRAAAPARTSAVSTRSAARRSAAWRLPGVVGSGSPRAHRSSSRQNASDETSSATSCEIRRRPVTPSPACSAIRIAQSGRVSVGVVTPQPRQAGSSGGAACGRRRPVPGRRADAPAGA